MQIEIREIVSFELGKEIEKYVFFRLVPRSWQDEKNISPYFFTELKTYHLS